MDRSTKMAFIIFVVVVVLMLALAAYGYFSGVWMAEFDKAG
jgi:flagellar basal body-associated protein FliL